jgi:hypothetical protein
VRRLAGPVDDLHRADCLSLDLGDEVGGTILPRLQLFHPITVESGQTVIADSLPDVGVSVPSRQGPGVGYSRGADVERAWHARLYRHRTLRAKRVARLTPRKAK